MSPVAKPGKWAQEYLAMVSSYGLNWNKNWPDWPELLGERRIGRRSMSGSLTASATGSMLI
jgi:hypothetical protein